jgi:hypothetical protein
MSGEIGKLVKDGFKTIESARKVAQDNAGQEAILKKADGTYAVHEVDLKERAHESVLNVINAKEGKSNEVVELYIDYLPEKIYRIETSDPQADSIGIGTKISDRYIDDYKENKFTTISEADGAAGQHKGMEAIVKNNDGSYSLYTLNLKEVENILKNPEKFPNIERINFPLNFYGASVETIYDAIDVHEKDKSGNYIHNFEDFKKRINRSDNSSVISWMHVTPDSLKLEKTDDYKDLENSSSDIGDKISSLRGMEKAQKIIDDLNAGRYVSLEGLTLLETSISDVISQVEKGTIKLEQKSIDTLKAMDVTVKKLKDTEEKLIESRHEFNAVADDAQQQVYNLDKKIKELKGKFFKSSNDTNTINTLEAILGNYVRISNSGNRENMALYAIFLKSELEYIESGGNDPKQVKLMMGKYNSIAVILNEFNEYGSLTPDARDIFFNHLKSLGAGPEGIKLFENYFNSKPANAATNPATFNFVDDTPQPEKRVIVDVGYAEKMPFDMEGISHVKPGIAPPLSNETEIVVEYGPSPKHEKLPLFTDEQLEEAGKGNYSPEIIQALLPEIRKTVEKLDKVPVAAFKVSENYAEKLKNLNDLNKQSPAVSNILYNLSDSIKEDIIRYRKSQAVIEQIVVKLVQYADQLQEELDLSVDGSAASIGALLDKFRAIISELDINTRDMIYKKLAMKLIDDSFSKFLKENKDKLNNQESTKEMMLKVFSDSKEVKEASMPFDLKQLKLNDNSLKIALMSLYSVAG